MKISLITSYLPELTSGSAVRTYHLLKNLSFDNDVTLFVLISKDEEDKFEKFKKTVHRQSYAFYAPDTSLRQRTQDYLHYKIPYVERLKRSSFHELLKFIPKDTDIVQLTELFSYFIVEPYISQLPGKIVLDAHNIDYLRIRSEFDNSSPIRKIAGYPIYKNLKKYEINALKRVDHVLTCSKKDKENYAKFINQNKITVIPNGVETDYFTPSNLNITPFTVFFMGNLSYPPNEYGLKWYIDIIHPELKKRYPKYRLIITGKGNPNWLQTYSSQDLTIDYRGLVDDVRVEIAKAHVCICPLFSGSGTRLKLLEYMSMGKAIVSTTKGAEGIGIHHKKELLLADSPHEFITAMVNIFHDKDKSITLGMNARVIVEKNYSWSSIINTLKNTYKKL